MTPKKIALGIVLSAALISACATTPSTPARQLVSSRDETRVGRRTFGAELAGNSVVASIRLTVECRTVKVYSDDEVASDWVPCRKSPPPADAESIAGVALTLQAGSIELEETTDAQGSAKFDLARLVESESAPREANVSIKLATTKRVTKVISLQGTPILVAWKKADAERKTEQRARTDKAEREAARAQALRTLEDLERGVAALRIVNNRWTTEQINELARLTKLATAIESGSYFDGNEQKRHQAVRVKLNKLVDSWGKVFDANQEQAASRAVAVGREIILKVAAAPSTVRFGSDALVLNCASGNLMTMHTFDAQNAFGAMLRQQWCLKFNPTTRRVRMVTTRAGYQVDTYCTQMNLGIPETCETMNARGHHESF